MFIVLFYTCSFKVELNRDTPNPFMALILKTMANYVGLTNKDMTSKWICFGCDGNVVF
jgi:hypothetical protein